MSAALDELLENPNYIVRVQEPGAFDPDRFASELVDHRQESKSPAVDRLIGNEVIAPNVIWVERSIFVRRALAHSTPFLLLLRHLQAFSLPNQSETVTAHRKAFGPQDGMDLPITEPRISLGQLVDSANQLRFFESA
jgi:hypothetical protein